MCDSGTVDKKEFVDGLLSIGVPDEVSERLEGCFDTIDADGSGAIEYKELKKALNLGGKEQREMDEKEEEEKPPARRGSVAADAAGEEDGDMPVPVAVKGDRLSAIAAAGGIYPLVGLVSVGSLMGKERAAGALWHAAAPHLAPPTLRPTARSRVLACHVAQAPLGRQRQPRDHCQGGRHRAARAAARRRHAAGAHPRGGGARPAGDEQPRQPGAGEAHLTL